MSAPADNYIISRDLDEAQRLDVQHQMMVSCQGYLLHPDIPIPSTGVRIAELATGTSIFLREVAAAHPAAECHGFDISDKMFPPQNEVPANVHLHIANAKEPFESKWQGYFDVVHIRLIMAAMRKDEWAPVLENILTLLKPGGWIQWVEDDRAHSVRHAARPVAPLTSHNNFSPARLMWLDRFNRLIMPNERADDMTYGYMNLDTLMQDAGLEHVGCDVYVIDREDDGGKLRREWAMMAIDAVWSMLKARGMDKEVEREELVEGFKEDVARGGYFLTRAVVFTGRKKI